MLNLKKEIRSTVGPRGMMIYTPDQSEVCIAYEMSGSSYTLKNEPAYLWEGREELFHLRNFEEYSGKEALILTVRFAIELFIATFLPGVLSNAVQLRTRTTIGLSFLLYSLVYIFEFSIMRGLKKQKSEKGKSIMRWRGALNKSINAFEKKKDLPTVDEIKSANLYRSDKDRYMEPCEISGIFFLMIAVSFFMPTLIIQLISIPLIICFTILVYKTSMFGLMRITHVLEPGDYEIQMASDLICFWYTISYKDLLQ